ncbi:MAG: GH36-type glycosyl hydrolase domain-containing protein [Thalassotalea sp.]
MKVWVEQMDNVHTNKLKQANVKAPTAAIKNKTAHISDTKIRAEQIPAAPPKQKLDKPTAAFSITDAGEKNSVVALTSPTTMPKAGAFLWNKTMMIQMNCRGYAVSQFMQPEPAKYSYAPNIEAKTFMQPEHHYYANHPGRFIYIKDEESGEIFSTPYEPVRASLDSFCFYAKDHEISWQVKHLAIEITLTLTLAASAPVEIWHCAVKNLADRPRKISVYPYFTFGYMSWMNQSATYNVNLNGIVATCVTPYQKVEQYFKNQELKDKTYFLSDTEPTAWLANQNLFEGEGGLSKPDALTAEQLTNQSANYDVPAGVFQFQLSLAPAQATAFNFLFGPAKDEQEIAAIKTQYFKDDKALAFERNAYKNYVGQADGCLTIKTQDKYFDDMVNHWLPRQMFYHGDVNRLTTDPQTRNYIQDNMGMCYLKPAVTRAAILTALSQQSYSGAMPDGVLLHPDAELKYINQVPHTDHCVWLPICLEAYLSETNDGDILKEVLGYADSEKSDPLITHIEKSIDWLLLARDERGLSYIEQGDWCDPMNMVGYKGKGVSAWLSLATVYAINCWVDICQHYVLDLDFTKMEYLRKAAKEISASVQKHLWDGDWFARGITDDNVVFGIKKDKEGRIYLNPQSWALLSDTATEQQKQLMLKAVTEQLITPFGVMMLAPSYTKMREDVGRLTQKHPGVSENGSVYNHAAVFYAYSLYKVGEAQQAFNVLKAMLPALSDAEKRGQLPVFIPNYYRGAYYQLPEQAGRSSHLFNTGTIAWFYRCIVEELCGLKGNWGELNVSPQLPKEITEISGVRKIQGATFNFIIIKAAVDKIKLTLDGKALSCNIVTNIQCDTSYDLLVQVPK